MLFQSHTITFLLLQNMYSMQLKKIQSHHALMCKLYFYVIYTTSYVYMVTLYKKLIIIIIIAFINNILQFNLTALHNFP